MQRPDIRETFEADLVLWSKAVISYCQMTQMRCTAIKKIITDYDAEMDSKIFFTLMVVFSHHIKYLS